MAQAFPLYQPEFLQYPQLHITPEGNVVLIAMTLDHADRVVEVWGAKSVWAEVALTLDGHGWQRNQVLPESAGEHEIRAAVAAGPGVDTGRLDHR